MDSQLAPRPPAGGWQNAGASAQMRECRQSWKQSSYKVTAHGDAECVGVKTYHMQIFTVCTYSPEELEKLRVLNKVRLNTKLPRDGDSHTSHVNHLFLFALFFLLCAQRQHFELARRSSPSSSNMLSARYVFSF